MTTPSHDAGAQEHIKRPSPFDIDDDCSQDPLFNEIREALNTTDPPDQGDLFFEKMGDDIMQTLRAQAAEEYVSPPPRNRPSLQKLSQRIALFFSNFAWTPQSVLGGLLVAAALLFVWSTPPEEKPSTSPSLQNQHAQATPVTEGAPPLFSPDDEPIEELDELSEEELRLFAEALPSPKEFAEEPLFEEESPSFDETLDNLNSKELAMLDQELIRLLNAPNRGGLF